MSQLKTKVTGIDLYNQSVTGGVSKTLSQAATDSDHTPVVVVTVEESEEECHIKESRER